MPENPPNKVVFRAVIAEFANFIAVSTALYMPYTAF